MNSSWSQTLTVALLQLLLTLQVNNFYLVTYLFYFFIPHFTSKQVFIELTMRDVFVYKAGAFTYFFRF